MGKFDAIFITLPNGDILPFEQAKEYCSKAIEEITIFMEYDKALNENNSIPFVRSRYQERRNQSEEMLKTFQAIMKFIEITENAQKGKKENEERN